MGIYQFEIEKLNNICFIMINNTYLTYNYRDVDRWKLYTDCNTSLPSKFLLLSPVNTNCSDQRQCFLCNLCWKLEFLFKNSEKKIIKYVKSKNLAYVIGRSSDILDNLCCLLLIPMMMDMHQDVTYNKLLTKSLKHNHNRKKTRRLILTGHTLA